MNSTENPRPTTTGQVPAAERLGLRTMEARIDWWVRTAREAADAEAQRSLSLTA